MVSAYGMVFLPQNPTVVVVLDSRLQIRSERGYTALVEQKDDGVQHYGGVLFSTVRDKARLIPSLHTSL